MKPTINPETLEQMASLGRDAALRAGELIRDRVGSPAFVETKAPADYVTDVDRESQALIVEMIRNHFPGHRILAEESTPNELGPGVTWIIDPLDGTTNYIHGFPAVAVSIAAYRDGEALIGLVLDPIRQELFQAKKGSGAFLNQRRIHVREVDALGEALVGTGFPARAKHLVDPYCATFKRVFERVGDIRSTGSASLDLAYVAAGRLDGYWELGLRTWDVAASALIVVEAGGMVSDFWGTGKYIENGHIVAGAPPVYPFLLDHARIFLGPSLEPVPGPRG